MVEYTAWVSTRTRRCTLHIVASIVNETAVMYDAKRDTYIKKLPVHVDETVKFRPLCRPFGMTWSDDTFYLVNNKRIHTYNKDFEYQHTIVSDLPENSHQMVHHNNYLYVASPAVNCVVQVDLDMLTKRYYDVGLLKWIDEPFGGDETHVNSLTIHGDKMYVNMHNNLLPSYITVHRLEDFKAIDLVDLGAGKAHNIAVIADNCYTLDTAGGRILGPNVDQHIASGLWFLRGFCATDTHFVIGVSSFDKTYRYGMSKIVTIDRRTNEQSEISVSGDISDVRILDEFDYAHGLRQFVTD